MARRDTEPPPPERTALSIYSRAFSLAMDPDTPQPVRTQAVQALDTAGMHIRAGIPPAPPQARAGVRPRDYFGSFAELIRAAIDHRLHGNT